MWLVKEYMAALGILVSVMYFGGCYFICVQISDTHYFIINETSHSSIYVTQEWIFLKPHFLISTVSKCLQGENIHENFKKKDDLLGKYNRLKIHA